MYEVRVLLNEIPRFRKQEARKPVRNTQEAKYNIRNIANGLKGPSKGDIQAIVSIFDLHLQFSVISVIICMT